MNSIKIENSSDLIIEIREKVIIDSDIAKLYGVAYIKGFDHFSLGWYVESLG